MHPALVTLLPALTLLAPCDMAERNIKGEVLLVGENDEPLPAVGIDVTIKETFDSTRTLASGLFDVYLKAGFKAGEKITLAVSKKGWVIQYPVEGETLIPADPAKQLIQVKLLPAGSKKLWSEGRIEKFVQTSITKAVSEIRPAGATQPGDLNRFIKEWAVQYGFSASQVKAEVDRWVADTEKKQTEPFSLGLAAYSKQNLGRAGELFERAGTAQLAEGEETQERRREAALRFQLAGDTRYADANLDKALQNYEQALDLVWKDEQPHDWALLMNRIGAANLERAMRSGGEETRQYLTKAIVAYQRALKVLARAQTPLDWAGAQAALGVALADKGTRMEGAEGLRLLHEAAEAFRHALEVYTREKQPQEWAAAQNGLGKALAAAGPRIGGTDGLALLGEAVAAHERSLEVFTRPQMPQQWAAVQGNIGEALWEQALRATGEEGLPLLARSAEAYKHALEVYQLKDSPRQRAAIQYSLASVLEMQGRLLGGEKGLRLVAEALMTYWQAATTYSPGATDADPMKASAWLVEMMALEAAGKTDALPGKLKAFRALLLAQPPGRLKLSVPDLRELVDQDEHLAPHRAKLRMLLAVADAQDRDSIIKAAEAVQAGRDSAR